MTIREAVEVSRVLEDGQGSLEASQAGQGRVHDLLSRGDGVEWLAAPGVKARVMARISVGAARRRSLGVWGPVAVAACVAGLGAAAWVGLRPTPSAPKHEPIAQKPGPQEVPVVAAAGTSSMDLSVIFRLPAQSDPAIAATVEEPLLREAQNIKDDSRAGVEMVLSRLPMGETLWR